MSVLQMDPDAVDEAGRRLRASGNDLQTSWSRIRSTIATYEGGIGTGRLGNAFRTSYQPASQQARANADPFPERIVDLGAAGQLSANSYVMFDASVAESFQGLRIGG